jgi:fatty acid desaturase
MKMDVKEHEAFIEALTALGRQLKEQAGPEDLKHLHKIRRWVWGATALGYATAWIAPNPISVCALSLGRFGRWTAVAHHIGHKGYDKVGGPKGKDFAEGRRRWLDWPDWIVPAAWKHEHNKLHHYRLNETADPDLVEHRLKWLRDKDWPLPAKLALVALFMGTWKWSYYAPNTLAILNDDIKPGFTWVLNPTTGAGRDLWLRSYLPYGLGHFVLIPAAFGAVLGPWAAVNVAMNSAMAEVLTNVHSFMVIVPNHAGADLFRFEDAPSGRGDFLMRQILGSANYRTGGDGVDFLHGFLNYQIEHHLWPDLPMRAYQRAQPQVKTLCEEHGIPYVQESVFKRVRRTVKVMVGRETMQVA